MTVRISAAQLAMLRLVAAGRAPLAPEGNDARTLEALLDGRPAREAGGALIRRAVTRGPWSLTSLGAAALALFSR